MRISIKQYQDGSDFALETSNDGTVVVAELLGSRKKKLASESGPMQRSLARNRRRGQQQWSRSWPT
jgi:hypothetical protein